MGHSVNRKLLDEEVIAIQKFLSEGELTQRQIAKLFSVTQAVIGSIKYGVRTIERHPAKEILRASEIKEWADFRAAKKTVKILGKLLKEKYGIR